MSNHPKMKASPNGSADNRVSILVRRYEEISYRDRVRPYLRRWMSTDATTIDPKERMSKFALLVDKVVESQKYVPFRNGSCEVIIGENDAVAENRDLKTGGALTKMGIFASHGNDLNHDSQPATSRNNRKNKRNLSETDRPLSAARSIEDFEEHIYFNEKNQQEKRSNVIADETDKSAEDAVEVARRRAKEEEEKYRRSVIEDEDSDDNEEIDVTKLLRKELKVEQVEDTIIDRKLPEQAKADAEETPKSKNNAETIIQTTVTKRDKKEFVVDELIKTERIYIEHLELLIKTYLHYLKQRRYKSETIKQVFSNIESIHEHSQIFLLHLEDCKYNYAEIGKVFCKHRDLFDKYPKYCRERKRSHQIITTDLKELVTHLQKHFNDKLGLNSSLLKPIQRLAKYELLLINLNQLLLQDNVNITSVQNAITLIQRVARIADTMVTLNTVKRCPYSFNDIGALVMQNEFKLLTPEKVDVMVFLFGKMVIFGEIVSTEEYNYRYSIPLDALRFNRPRNSTVLVLEHFTKYKKAVYNLENKEVKVVNAWSKEINDILWKQLEMCKGKVQGQPTLVPLKNTDAADNAPKSSPVKAASPNKSTIRGYLSKPTQPAKTTKVTTKSKSSTKTEPAKSKHITKPSNTIETNKSPAHSNISKTQTKRSETAKTKHTTTNSADLVKSAVSLEQVETVKSAISVETSENIDVINAGLNQKEVYKCADIEQISLDTKSRNGTGVSKQAKSGTRTDKKSETTVSKSSSFSNSKRRVKNDGKSSLSGSMFYLNCDETAASLNEPIGTSKISAAKIKAVKSSSRADAKKTEKQKDRKRKIERRMAMVYRM